MNRLKFLATANLGLAAAAVCGWTLLLANAGESRGLSSVDASVTYPSFVPSPWDKCTKLARDDQDSKVDAVDAQHMRYGGRPESSKILQVASPKVALKCTPHTDSATVRAYGLGHKMVVVGARNTWLAVKSVVDGTEGWLEAEHVEGLQVAAVSGTDPRQPRARRLALREASNGRQPPPVVFGPSRQHRNFGGSAVSDVAATHAEGKCVWEQVSRGHWSCVR